MQNLDAQKSAQKWLNEADHHEPESDAGIDQIYNQQEDTELVNKQGTTEWEQHHGAWGSQETSQPEAE